MHKNWNIEIIIVDNASSDDSVLKVNHFIDDSNSIHELNVIPSWFKQTGTLNNNIPIHFINSDINGGFAYGNNIGINKAKTLSLSDNDYVWLLNNDTYTQEFTLPKLISTFDSKDYGLLGSQIVNFTPPHENQSYCGVLSINSANLRVFSSQTYPKKQQILYPVGASLFTSIERITKVGLMDESYFLYYEELDWSIAFMKKGYELGIVKESIVYHKQGATTGSIKNKNKSNLGIERYKYLGIIRFYKKHYPGKLYAAYFSLLKKAGKWLLKGDFQHCFLIFRIIFSKN
jgi:GT2 family glycosyltransferase